MHHAKETVTIYHREWDEAKGTDVYRRTVLSGVSFFSRISTAVSTDGLTAACEGTLRIPMEACPDGLILKNGDLVCEGDLQKELSMPSELDGLCPYVYTVVGVTHNSGGRCPHTKVVCK